MEVAKDALLRIVQATRTAIALAEDVQRLFPEARTQSYADIIAGELCDALYKISGERMAPWQDFVRDSITMKLLRSRMSDGDVTDKLLELHELHDMKNQPEQVEQPKPNTCSKADFDKMHAKAGGYRYDTPEGDWE